MADTERGFTFSEDELSTALAEALRYFKYDSLKVEQIECLRRVICLREDVLAVLPTGFGKSLIYRIIPKVLECLRNESNDTQKFIVCIVSPLEYIRKQQVASINKLHGLPAAAVGDNEETDKDIEDGGANIVFGSAEQWLSDKWKKALQFGSLHEAAVLVVDEVQLNMDGQRVTFLILLDLSAAFDTVDHDVLHNRLSTDFGIKGTALKWFESYLSNRRQRVSIEGVTSKLFDLDFGVPQGSCLGPLLFLLYSSKLFKIISRHLPSVHAYADDTQLYLSFKAGDDVNEKSAIAAMEACVHRQPRRTVSEVNCKGVELFIK